MSGSVANPELVKRSQMTLRGPVLVGTDLSPLGDEALRQGAALAAALHSALLVCHVIPELLPHIALFARPGQNQWRGEESVLAKARHAVEEHLKVLPINLQTAADIVLKVGTPHVGLLTAAEEKAAGVIVVGPGRTALDVVRHAAAAVLVTRTSPNGPVVGATDFSDPSVPGLPIAAAEARRRGVALHLLHAWDLNVFMERRAPATALPYLEGKSWIALEGLDELRTVAERRLAEMLRDAGVPGETAIVSGFAADVIVQYAEHTGAGLLVVGTHGRSGFKRLLLGSTAASVIERAPCSVLVVRVVGQ
jgi:nucleotide-binding universal stress UspA family protein